MKRLYSILFSLIPVLLLIFIAVMFLSGSDTSIWRAFSLIMPLVGICFWGGVILLLVDYIISKRK